MDNSAQELSIHWRQISEYDAKAIFIVCRDVRISSPVMLSIFLKKKKYPMNDVFRNVSLVIPLNKRIKYYFDMNDL